MNISHSEYTIVPQFGKTYILQHPQYGQGTGFTPNDFAVVVTNTIPSGIGPANIARSAANPGGKGWITGWGRTCGEKTFYFCIHLIPGTDS